jgi:hypothetical protein
MACYTFCYNLPEGVASMVAPSRETSAAEPETSNDFDGREHDRISLPLNSGNMPHLSISYCRARLEFSITV